jgi:tRNA(Ile)-lysidine synthase
MLAALNKFIAENNIISHGDKILLTVSGGIDSMVMAHLFLHLPYETAIAHCNFSLRGKESDGDEQLVKSFAEANGKPFFTTRFDTKSYAKNNNISVQMAARELRYKWFEKIRSDNNYDLIAVAHNLNDNIETLIINLTRGTGLTGLSGIRPVSGKIIRPVMFATRDSIKEYCKKHSIEYREDRSNAETKYTRNKIRHLVLPVLKEINPSIETTLASTCERISGINKVVNSLVSDIKKKISRTAGNNLLIDIETLQEYLTNKSLLFEIFKEWNISNYQIDDLLNVIHGRSGGMLITDSHRIVKNRSELIIVENTKSEADSFIVRNAELLGVIPWIISSEIVIIDESFRIPADPVFSCLDLQKLTFPLTVRRWKAGDHFFPLGMNKKKKLSDYFIDNKISITDKENKIIIESDGKIACVLGDKIDDRYKITAETNKALLIKSAG